MKLEAAGFSRSQAVRDALLESARAVDHTRLGKRVGRLSAEAMIGVDEALRLVLALP